MGDIVEHNQSLEGPQDNEYKNDFERGTFGRTELLCGRIKVTNQAEGVVWGRNMCTKTTDAKQKLRTYLSAVRRKQTLGMYTAHTAKKKIYTSVT